MIEPTTASAPLAQIPPDVASAADYERLAKQILPHSVYEYIAGGSADDLTLCANRAAFDRIGLYSRALVDCRAGGTALSLLGHKLRHPILLAPVAHQRLAHPEAELATARAAEAMEAGLVASTLSSHSLEAIASKTRAAKWFQLYFQPQQTHTLELVRRAEQAGYTALVVTVDVPVNGLRNRAQRAGFTLPAHVQAENLRAFEPPPQRALTPEQSVVFQGIMGEAPSWHDLVWLKSQTQLPILIKGVLHPDDATRVMELGLAGVVVSNHGGRSLDGVPAAIDCLAAVRAAAGPDAVVLLDSGIRRGSDVFKALALGADAVMVGRPQIYALAVAGALGVAHLLRLLREELEVTMALTGCPTIASITPNALVRPGQQSL